MGRVPRVPTPVPCPVCTFVGPYTAFGARSHRRRARNLRVFPQVFSRTVLLRPHTPSFFFCPTLSPPFFPFFLVRGRPRTSFLQGTDCQFGSASSGKQWIFSGFGRGFEMPFLPGSFLPPLPPVIPIFRPLLVWFSSPLGRLLKAVRPPGRSRDNSLFFH